MSSAIHLRFDVKASSLPEFYKARLLNLKGQRINKEGVIIIKAQTFRTQEKNREDALSRLQSIIREAVVIQKVRRQTKPTKGAKMRRVDSKTKRGKTKSLRGKVFD